MDTRFRIQWSDLQHIRILYRHQNIQQVKKNVLHGYGKYKCNIEGIGAINISIAGRKIKFIIVIYVPTLECPIIRIKRHMQLVGFTQHAEKNQVVLTFCTILVDVTVSDEITITIKNLLTINRYSLIKLHPKYMTFPQTVKLFTWKINLNHMNSISHQHVPLRMWFSSLQKQNHNLLDKMYKLSDQNPS